jgi:ribosomal protein S18 acetylase RimI-like enzyme
MPLPTPIRDFVYAFEALGAHTLRTAWGLVVTDPRYPQVYDANKACVLEAAPRLTVAEIREALTPALDAARIAFEHIEIMDLDDAGPARGALTRTAGRVHPDAVMVHASDPEPVPRPAAGIHVRELEPPDEGFWRVYRTSRNEFGGAMPDEVVDQLVLRDREVLAPAGLRFFAGLSDGEVVGFSTLLSIGGVGYLDNVVTLRAFRRLGVASATVVMAVHASRAAGDGQTFLLTDLHGTARTLYERLGFRLARRAAGFTYPRPGA